MELKYIDILYTLKYYNVPYQIEWMDANKFKVTVNQQSAIIEQSTTSAPFPLLNGPRRVKPTGFTKVHEFKFTDGKDTEPINIEFKKETYIENQQESYECDEGVHLLIDQKPIINDYLTDDCIRTQSSKWFNFQKKYGIDVSKTILEKVDLTEDYNQDKFMYWVDGTIYSQYFRFHKPNVLIALAKTNVKTDDKTVTVQLRTMNSISKKLCGIPFDYNVILQAVGFVKDKQVCRCDINRWQQLRQFIGIEDVQEEVMQSETTYPHQGLYLLQLNCDQGSNKFKLGKAQNLLRRLKSTEYRNAFIICTSMSKDIDRCERELIEEFNKKFTNVKEADTGGFGAEMFTGDVYAMIDLFWSICAKWR